MQILVHAARKRRRLARKPRLDCHAIKDEQHVAVQFLRPLASVQSEKDIAVLGQRLTRPIP
jgi:hypothetical protein